ncbi:hypothetical protein EI94DRAFT_1748035 [Lactarius quietus]|nr:hypothetical protein EI94DRAFT_1748035 [Lactarius quietus]
MEQQRRAFSHRCTAYAVLSRLQASGVELYVILAVPDCAPTALSEYLYSTTDTMDCNSGIMVVFGLHITLYSGTGVLFYCMSASGAVSQGCPTAYGLPSSSSTYLPSASSSWHQSLLSSLLSCVAYTLPSLITPTLSTLPTSFCSPLEFTSHGRPEALQPHFSTTAVTFFIRYLLHFPVPWPLIHLRCS